ncbi:MAG TPA: bifunctional folylpolyglutamate synthase/dihydrofolate synthase, partial [Epsilonproteobacteria bacterium]|nr:bifunctional folylpolyglutamate synthase/dihydrofolate synthase [Campylobacterota bacterium]
MQTESLSGFLDRKPLYYKEIDHTRVHQAYAILKPHIRHPKTVHIVGTNGKGSTGRMMAYLAWRQGSRSEEVGGRSFSVGHYSSPHILKFNERIWLDGEDASDEVLETAHRKLFAILGKEMAETLSYFEYTTLLALVVFEKCDLVVLEAGLGGEFDATNVCDKELSVITPIGIDHQAFLGESIEAIAATKIRSIQKRVLLAPQPYDEVVAVAKQIADEKKAELFSAEHPKGISPFGRARSAFSVQNLALLRGIAEQKGWPTYLVDNAMVACQALDILDISYDVSDLKTLELFGRFYPLSENIRIDVGHNPLAAKAIVASMESETVLIYNSLDDKDYEAVLRTLKPKVKRVEIISIASQRATTIEAIETALNRVGINYSMFEGDIDS